MDSVDLTMIIRVTDVNEAITGQRYLRRAGNGNANSNVICGKDAENDCFRDGLGSLLVGRSRTPIPFLFLLSSLWGQY